MSINIYKKKTFEKIVWLCEDIWDLPIQIHELEKWLTENEKNLSNANYVIDIGFDINAESSGGGAVISSNMMKIMSDNNIDLYLSEYPESKIDR